MNISEASLRAEVKALSPAARRAIRRAVKDRPHVDEALLLAIGSRESWLTNITGDGGHARGMFAQDDRFLGPWLGSVRGCRSGSSIPRFGSARPKGRVPTISAGARKCATIVEGNIVEAKRASVVPGHRTHVGVAGYNAGLHGAISAYRLHGSPDVATAHGDYGADVLERARFIRAHKL